MLSTFLSLPRGEHLKKPSEARNVPQTSALLYTPSPGPHQETGGAGAVVGVARGALVSPFYPRPPCCPTPLQSLLRLQSTCRCGAVGRNQGAQVRNGAWQALACPRLPECNFPVITLPSFSASVKDHLLTHGVGPRPGGPSLRIRLRRQRKRIEPRLSGPDFVCPPETNPGDQPMAPNSLEPASPHPNMLSPSPTHTSSTML